MAKKRFSKAAFLAGNEKAKSGSGDFPTVPSGVYIATVEKCYFKEHDSGAQSISFGFQIDPEEEEFANQYFWWNPNIIDKKGNDNEIGLQQVNFLLMALAEGNFNAEDFADNPDEELERFLFTKARFKVKYKKVGEYDNYTVEVLTVLENKYAGPNAKPASTQTESFDSEELDQDNDDDDSEDVEIGDKVMYHHKKGDFEGVILGFVEADGVNVKEDKLLIEITHANGKTQKLNVDPTVCDMLEKVKKKNEHEKAEEESLEIEDEIEEEEEEELEITIGSDVQSTFKGENFQGIVKAIDEDEGIVKISYNSKLRKCKLENTQLV